MSQYRYNMSSSSISIDRVTSKKVQSSKKVQARRLKHEGSSTDARIQPKGIQGASRGTEHTLPGSIAQCTLLALYGITPPRCRPNAAQHRRHIVQSKTYSFRFSIILPRALYNLCLNYLITCDNLRSFLILRHI